MSIFLVFEMNLPRIVEQRRPIISRNVSDLNISTYVIIILQFVTTARIPNERLHFATYFPDLSFIVRQFVAPNPVCRRFLPNIFQIDFRFLLDFLVVDGDVLSFLSHKF
jgi:hypothetical protein